MSSFDGQVRKPPKQHTSISPITGALIDKIRNGDPNAAEELSHIVQPGVKLLMRHHLRRDVADGQVQNAVWAVVQAIKAGDLRNRERIGEFVRSVVQHQITLDHGGIEEDQRRTAEEHARRAERTETMRRLLLEFSPRQRDALTRFYTLAQTEDEICRTTELTRDDFRALKAKVKARFAASRSGTAHNSSPGWHLPWRVRLRRRSAA